MVVGEGRTQSIHELQFELNQCYYKFIYISIQQQPNNNFGFRNALTTYQLVPVHARCALPLRMNTSGTEITHSIAFPTNSIGLAIYLFKVVALNTGSTKQLGCTPRTAAIAGDASIIGEIVPRITLSAKRMVILSASQTIDLN